MLEIKTERKLLYEYLSKHYQDLKELLTNIIKQGDFTNNPWPSFEQIFVDTDALYRIKWALIILEDQK